MRYHLNIRHTPPAPAPDADGTVPVGAVVGNEEVDGRIQTSGTTWTELATSVGNVLAGRGINLADVQGIYITPDLTPDL